MDELAELIVSSHARWMPRVVEAIFGTTDPVSVAEALTEAVAAALAVPVVAAQFYEPGVGVVVGLDLADGRAVVAKVHRATFMPLERLATIARLRADLVAAGVPAPAPFTGPLVLGKRLAHRRGTPRRRLRRWVRPRCSPRHGECTTRLR